MTYCNERELLDSDYVYSLLGVPIKMPLDYSPFLVQGAILSVALFQGIHL